MAKTVFLFPGQGSQFVGMGKDLFDAHQSVRDLFGRASETLGIDLQHLCFNGPESELVRTDNVQPAITLVNAACHLVLKEAGVYPAAAAGHSLGEYAALYAAGVYDFEAMMQLVHYRGICMQEAAEGNPGGMIAVMHLDVETVENVCNEARKSGYLVIANINSSRQIILSGDGPGIQKGIELAKQYGAKMVIPLKVSGSWHSRFMDPAASKMAAMLAGTDLQRPFIPVVSNVTASYALEPEVIRQNLCDQITRPVLWNSSMQGLLADGYRRFVEVGPKRVLRGLMRDIDRKAEFFNVGDLKSLDDFLNPAASV